MSNDDVDMIERSEKAAQKVAETDEEEIQQRLEENREELEEKYGEELVEDIFDDIDGEDLQEFFTGMAEGMKKIREVKSQSGVEPGDYSRSEDYDWEDGFTKIQDLTNDPDTLPTCLVCREALDPEQDVCRVADGCSLVYTKCSTCGEDKLEDRRGDREIMESLFEPMPPAPDGDIEVMVDEELNEQLSQDQEE